MAQHDAVPAGAPCWVDLFSSDTERAERFYGQLFGWSAEHSGAEYGGYINFAKDTRLVAGCMHNDGSAGSPDQWSVYLSTDDAEATAEAVAAHGGQVIVPVVQVPDKGSMAIVADAGQAGIGVWQPGSHQGFGVLAEPGSPAWFELHTRDYTAAVRFYEDVFGWDTHVESDTDDFRYTTLGRGESARAGVMDVSGFPAEQFPVRWSVYFGVQDADAAAAKAVELGGAVAQGPDDSPYGRLATLADPTGASFKVVAVDQSSTR